MALDRRNQSGYVPLRDAIDRLFAQSFITPTSSGIGFPPADMTVTDNDVILDLAVPGASPDDINVSVTGDTVTISGAVNREHRQGKGHEPFVHEIWHGQFQRSFTLPIEVDAAKAEASFDNGVLTVKMPKSEATKPRKIQVKTSGSGTTIEGKSTSTSESGSTTGSQTHKETVPVQSGSENARSGSSSGRSS